MLLSMIRKVTGADYPQLVRLYQSFFLKHNRFQKPAEEVIVYLKEQAKDNLLLVYEEKGKIKGALIIVQTGSNAEGTHKVWKYRHFAFTSENIAVNLLKEVEAYVKKQSKTAKVELTIAESEPGIDFYRTKGYVQEAALTNHYRWGETCFILTKSFS